jgi:hypothetical protein
MSVIRRLSGSFTWLLLAGLVVAALPPSAEAFQQRRPSPAQRKRQQEAMKKMQAQMKAYQAEVARYQKEMAAKHAEIVKRFDENGDGRLFGVEKSKYDKYMYAVQKGKEANPFADIKPVGQGGPPATAKKPDTKK